MCILYVRVTSVVKAATPAPERRVFTGENFADWHMSTTFNVERVILEGHHGSCK